MFEKFKEDAKQQARQTRIPLTENDKKMVSLAKHVCGFYGEVATSVEKQGWWSPKQRAVIVRAQQTFSSRPAYKRSGHQADYNESDYEIGAYELCVDWAK